MSDLIKKLCENFDIEMPIKAKDKSYLIEIIDGVEIKLWDLDPGFYFHCNLDKPPEKKREAFFIYLMRANVLGQGTGGARIGMDEKEKFLTLSYNIDYEVTYIEFKEKIEDFVNYINFWRDEITKYKEKIESSIL